MTFPYSSALVTGGAGFIGSHITDALLAVGCRVTVLDNLSTGRLENLEHVRDRVVFVQGDIRDTDTLDRVMGGCQVVFHEAALVSVPQSVSDPAASADINDFGTFLVLDAARRNGARRVVLASSAAIYGDAAEVPVTEDARPGPALSPYALHKRFGELHADLFQRIYGLETTCLRYFNVYGPRQDPSSPYSGVISIFMDRAIAGIAPALYGDGGQTRDFVFVGDVAQANLMAASSPGVVGGRFNVGTGRAITINELWKTVSHLAGLDLAPAYGTARAGDIRHSVAAVSRLSVAAGFSAQTPFETGLALTLDWYRQRKQ